MSAQWSEEESLRRQTSNGGQNGADEDLPGPDPAPQKEENTVRLEGKVALIVGGAGQEGRSLAVAFAERDIDVALVTFGERHDLAGDVRQAVEARGRRCLLIHGHRDADAETFARRAVYEVLRVFGRLDIFINFSSQALPLRLHGDEETQQERALRSHFFPHFPLMKAALEEMTE